MHLEHRPPTVDEFRRVAEAVGWGDRFDWTAMHRALAASLHAVVAVESDEVVATARLVGDGVRYFYLQDVMVDPRHSDDGIASHMTETLLEWARSRSADGGFIGLFASPEAEGVYSELGFGTAEMTGMHRGL